MARTAWGDRVDAVLADGEWHEVEYLIGEAVRCVPPGIAYRNGERERQVSRGTRGSGPGERRRGSAETSIASGARRRVKQTIRSRVRHGHAVQEGTRIRMPRRAGAA